MWLPAAGSLHTVVLLTPGKWAARWICRGRCRQGDRRVDVGIGVTRRIAVLRSGQAEPSPQGGIFVVVDENRDRLQEGHEHGG